MSIKRPVAVLDLDDTLINTREAMYQCVKQRHGKDVIRHWSDWTDFKFEDNTNVKVDDLIQYTVEDRVFENIEPHPHSEFFLKDLMARGFYVVILTAREGFVPNPHHETDRYLRKFGLEYDDLIISDHGANKVDFLKKFDTIEFAIDDQVQNCIDLEESGKVNHVFLHALPFNKSCMRFIRLHSLYQAYKHLGIE